MGDLLFIENEGNILINNYINYYFFKMLLKLLKILYQQIV